MTQPTLLVIGDSSKVPARLTDALTELTVKIEFRSIANLLAAETAPYADAYVLIAADRSADELARLRQAAQRLALRPRGAIVVAADGSEAPYFTHSETIPIAFDAGGVTREPLAPRIRAMLEIRHALAALHKDAVVQRAVGARAARRCAAQMRLARQTQREFLPSRLPVVPGVSFACIYRAIDYVSGDLFDVQRLDNDHIGLAVADATGHGISAALLTVFVKRAMRGLTRAEGVTRILNPAEVLRRLNDEILDADLLHCRFVAASYALLNIRTRELTVARGGAPYPLLRRRGGTIEQLSPEGGVIGVIPEMQFTVESCRLDAGDELILYTDGLDPLVQRTSLASGVRQRALECEFAHAGLRESLELANDLESAAGRTAVLEQDDEATCAPCGDGLEGVCGITDEPDANWWLRGLRERGAAAAISMLRNEHDEARRAGGVIDDLTVLAARIDDVN